MGKPGTGLTIHEPETSQLTTSYVYGCCWCSLTQLCPTLCNPMDCSTPGLPVLSPGACSNSCPLSRGCHPTISSSVTPFSSCLQFFAASGSFPTSWLFALGGQSIGASASASVLPMNAQDWLDLLAVQGTLESSPTPQFKSISSSGLSLL